MLKKPSTPRVYHSRIDDIINYRKHHTLEQTGNKFKLSSERIRQIVQERDRKRCSVHNRFYYNKCSYCMASSYKKMLRFIKWHDLEKMIDKEAKDKSRDYLAVQRRVALIEIMKHKYNMNFTQIASRFKKDRSTIVHLFNNYIK